MHSLDFTIYVLTQIRSAILFAPTADDGFHRRVFGEELVEGGDAAVLVF